MSDDILLSKDGIEWQKAIDIIKEQDKRIKELDNALMYAAEFIAVTSKKHVDMTSEEVYYLLLKLGNKGIEND